MSEIDCERPRRYVRLAGHVFLLKSPRSEVRVLRPNYGGYEEAGVALGLMANTRFESTDVPSNWAVQPDFIAEHG
jgi:hypothetical protein